VISTESGSKTLEEEDWSADMRGPAGGGRREWARSSSTQRERENARVGLAPSGPRKQAGGGGGARGVSGLRPGYSREVFLFFFFSFLVSKPIINIFKNI
jgi:hypothetical protein